MEIILGIVSIIVGIILSIGIFLFQERKPKISVTCRLVSSGDPSAIECVISNSGRKAAQDVNIGFSFMLLNETVVVTSSDASADLVGRDIPIRIHSLDTLDASLGIIFPSKLPDPYLCDSDANHVRAFAIRVNSVPAKSKVEFRLITNDIENRRAARQVMYIRDDINKRIKTFIENLKQNDPKGIKKIRYQDFISGRAKCECFFKPGYFSFSEERGSISFLSKNEITALDSIEKLFKKYKDDYPNLFKNQPKFISPVVRFRTDNGTYTLAITPPFGTSVSILVKGEDYQKLIRGEQVYPPIPEKYDYE